jgi:hypothetical protein
MASGEFRRAKHADLSGQQVADRLAIRERSTPRRLSADVRSSLPRPKRGLGVNRPTAGSGLWRLNFRPLVGHHRGWW